MSINDFAEKVKSKISPFYWLILTLIIASIFFALGRLSVIEERHQPIRVIGGSSADVAGPLATDDTEKQTANAISAVYSGATTSAGTDAAGATATSAEGRVIGSKNGKKYFFPWCGSLKMVKPENRVTFASTELAKQAGYTPAGNCKGLK